MNNEIVNKSFLTRLKGVYQAKYGIEMDEWSAMVLYEICENFEDNNKVAENTIKEIEKASNLIKGQLKPIHFANEGQAYNYGFGKSIPYAVAILVIGIIFSFITIDILEYRELKSTTANFRNYKVLIQHGVIEEQKGHLFLILNRHNEKADSVNVGKEFFLTKDNETVWIPLGPKMP